MKTFLFLLLIIPNIGYSQIQPQLGKFYNEVQSSISTLPTLLGNRKALFANNDNSKIFYVFKNDICVEYNVLFRTSNIDSLNSSIREFSDNYQFNIVVKRIDTNLINVVISK